MKSPFLEVPTDVWLDMRLLPTLPRFVQLPRYDLDDYEVADSVEQPSLESLRAFDNRTVSVAGSRDVRYASRLSGEIGALILSDDRAFLCSLRRNQKGANELDLSKAGQISLLAAKPGEARSAEQLSYATVVRAIQHRAVVARIDGTTVDYELALDPRPRRTGIRSATDALQLLARTLEDRNRWNVVGDAPLAVALRARHAELNAEALRRSDNFGERLAAGQRILPATCNLDELYARTATQFIRDYELVVSDPVVLPDLDSLSPEAVRAALEQRVLATLRIAVTDAAWTAHLHDASSWMHVDERSLPPPPE